MDAKKHHQEISLADRIKQLRLSKGLTQKAFADSLGIVQGYLSGLESGRKIPSHTLLIAICHIHGVREEWLFDGVGEAFGEPPQQPERSADAAGGRIPLLRRIPEGFPDKLVGEDIADYIALPHIPKGCFAIVAEGDFMSPTIRDGDVVIFKPGSEKINRCIVLLSNKWGEVILRRARITGREIFFSAENTVYAPFHPDTNTRIFGTVIDVWRRVRII
ncbi:MAG TPA: XRE family transcriptional regulator [Geobacteraceae bacterium]|nr:XRE family transcriptional regulator [Geobacteraceae bacterium]